MKQTPKTSKGAYIVPENSAKINTFETLKRDFEADPAGNVYPLACACVASVLRKLADPTRKTSPADGMTANSGVSPVIMGLRRDLWRDSSSLRSLEWAGMNATRGGYNDNGDCIAVEVDPDAVATLEALSMETLSDASDLLHTAVLSLLEQAQSHASGEGWTDTPYNVRRLARKVYIRLDDSAEYREEETTPMQEVYRAIRRAVQSSATVQTDPRNGYVYLEDFTESMDAIYYRMGKYADMGGSCTDINGRPSGEYTAGGISSAMEYNAVLDALNLTRRQREIVELRMRGYGYKAIATYLGVDPRAIHNGLDRIRAKCEKIGFTPDMWEEMSR